MYPLFEFILAIWGSVFKPMWDSLPPIFQGSIAAVIVVGLVYRKGWNDRVRAVYRADLDKAESTRQAGIR